MSKRMVVITGSPRKNGNSFSMTDVFIKAAEAKGYMVTRFDAAMKNVSGCHACETCFKTGKACSFDDDFNTIAPVILDADAVVFTMPVYWYSIPAQIKSVIDKLFSFCVAGKDIAGPLHVDVKEAFLEAGTDGDHAGAVDQFGRQAGDRLKKGGEGIP